VLNHKIQHGPESVEELLEHQRERSQSSLQGQIKRGGTTRGGGLMDEDD
jgi:cytochrome d ubiquinol oxidase subunit I